jgi:DnaJ-like protein
MDVIADPDCRLFTLMAAYAALEVPCSASSQEIRRAHRHLVVHDHPDLHHAGSEDHRNAMARMAAINDAYELVRDAPLRLVDLRVGSALDATWRDHEIDDAIRRGRADRLMRAIGLTGLAMLVAVALTLPLGLRLDRGGALGFHYFSLVVPAAFGLVAAVVVNRVERSRAH